MMKIYISAFFLLAVACQSTSSRSSDVDVSATDLGTTDSPELPPDFINFYQQFHDDSSFQIAHIMFPLAGIPANADTLSSNLKEFKWQLEDWKIHRPFDQSLTGYTKEYSKFEDGIVIETIAQKQVGVGMERRFAKIDTEWMLIYYAGMNYLK